MLLSALKEMIAQPLGPPEQIRDFSHRGRPLLVNLARRVLRCYKRTS